MVLLAAAQQAVVAQPHAHFAIHREAGVDAEQRGVAGQGHAFHAEWLAAAGERQVALRGGVAQVVAPAEGAGERQAAFGIQLEMPFRA